ncbi:GtrA-like protein [compost metagenome]
MSQFIRYCTVGIISNSLLYLGYLIIVYFGIGTKTSMTLMYLSGVAFGFCANYRWTFSQLNSQGTLLRYTLMHVVGYILNLSILYVFVDKLNYPHQAVQITAILLVAIYGFFTCKYFVFRSFSK